MKWGQIPGLSPILDDISLALNKRIPCTTTSSSAVLPQYMYTGGWVSNWRRRLRKCDSDLTPGCRKLGQRDLFTSWNIFRSLPEGNTAMEFQWNTSESDEIKLCEKLFWNFPYLWPEMKRVSTIFLLSATCLNQTIGGVDLTISAEILLGFVSQTQGYLSISYISYLIANIAWLSLNFILDTS